MDKEKIRDLLNKYYEGETSVEEERQLKKYFLEGKADEEFIRHRDQFVFWSDQQNERYTKNTEELFSKLPAEKVIPLKTVWNWGIRIAAGLLLLVLGFAGGTWYAGKTSPEIADLKDDVQEMKKMLMLTSMNQASASERIKAVSQSTELDEANLEIIEALIRTLNSDNNVNVRLASCEALYHWKENPLVRRGLTASLVNQKDPAIQITIIDMLITMKEKSAVPEMQKLTQTKEVMDIVKKKAEYGIARLL